MKHFYRTSVHPDIALAEADSFFPTIGMKPTATAARSRKFEGSVGEPGEAVTLELTVKRGEGGHYTVVDARTSAQGESRLDRGVKNYFVHLHKIADPRHALSAAY